MTFKVFADQTVGALLAAITLLVIFNEWSVLPQTLVVLPALVLALVAILAVQVRASRKAFVGVAVILTVALGVSDPGWTGAFAQAIGSAAFIAAFFTALSTLRNVAQTSPAIRKAGRFLAAQPPGRRYAALTAGGQMFALLLNYGAIQLLGALAMANASTEPNVEIRNHRIRRMLLAIQRAFVSTLPWSPLSFAVAISTAVIPGASWAQALIPGLITSVLVAGIGWALDTLFKPRLTVTPTRTAPEGSWALMLPLFILLGLLVVSVGTLFLATGIRVIGLVTVIVPLMALGWLILQNRGAGPEVSTVRRVRDYLIVELPTYRGEIILLMMAGYIGTIGAQLLAPLMVQTGLDLSSVPPWLILVSFVWIIPLAGQIGMNPILAVTLIAPLIPAPEALGVTPTALVVAITAGWALSGASSPFTASTLMISTFGSIPARRVGMVWNGPFTLVCAVVLSVWVVIYGLLI